MPRNLTRFQKEIGLHEFIEKSGSDAQCHEALYHLRWPAGYVCPECDNKTGCKLNSRPVCQRNKCHHKASLTAETIFHSTKLPLNKWFLAIYLLTQRKKGTSALQLSRKIGVNYNTAWKVKHKLMQVMMEHQNGERLFGRIEIDDAYLGGELPRKRGRGSHKMIPFMAAVETTQDGRPRKIHLRRVRDFRLTKIALYAKSSLQRGSTIFSDGLRCFSDIGEFGCKHVTIVTGGGRQSAQHPTFKWVNTMLGNVRNALLGTFYAIRDKHVPRYLAGFEFRLNRRFDLLPASMIEPLLFIYLRTPPLTCRHFRVAEVYG